MAIYEVELRVYRVLTQKIIVQTNNHPDCFMEDDVAAALAASADPDKWLESVFTEVPPSAEVLSVNPQIVNFVLDGTKVSELSPGDTKPSAFENILGYNPSREENQ